jgi:hypothetical protein
MKNIANNKVRISTERVSTPNGVNRKPKMKPIPNKTANMCIALVKGAFIDLELFFFHKLPLINLILLLILA